MANFIALPTGVQSIEAEDHHAAATLVGPIAASDLVIVDADAYARLLTSGKTFHVTRDTRVSEA